jgi:uncharacterized protein (TIGR01777 family)
VSTAPPRTDASPRLTIAIAGVSGMLGGAVAARLTASGHTVRRIGRRPATSDIVWDPEAGRLEPSALDAVDAIANFAGETIAQRWTADRKRIIRESRLRSTDLLARTAAALHKPPSVFVGTSAVGYYGNRGDEILDESSSQGAGFLAGLVGEWEAAADPARAAGIRVVHPRFGVVMSPRGGALAKLLPIFSMGGGGKIGDGRQWMSWIGLDDLARAVIRLIEDASLREIVNVTSPNPVTNAEFAETLGKVLHRPSMISVPGFAVRMLYGEMGEETVLAGQRVMPRVLEHAGFAFAHPRLQDALRFELA